MRARFVLTLALLFSAVALLAEQGRVIGTVVDDKGEPIEDVNVSIRSLENNITRDAKTNGKGRFTISLPETNLTWLVALDAEGYPSFEEPLGEVPGGVYKKTWKLTASTEGDEIPPEMARIFNEGAIAYSEKKDEIAKQRFETVIATLPNLVPAWRALGPIYLHLGEYEKALSASEKLLSLETDDPVGLKVQHDANEKLGHFDASVAALDRLVQVERSPEVAARVFNSAAASLQSGDDAVAIRRFRQALEIDPGMQSACSALGNLLLSKKAFAEALASVDECLVNQPDNIGALTVRFNSLRGLGREPEADEAFAKLQAGDPKVAARVTFRQGELLFELGNTEQALATFEKTLAADPNHAGAHYRLGLAMINLGRTEEAKKYLGRYIELDPEGENVPSAREMLEYLE